MSYRRRWPFGGALALLIFVVTPCLSLLRDHVISSVRRHHRLKRQAVQYDDFGFPTYAFQQGGAQAGTNFQFLPNGQFNPDDVSLQQLPGQPDFGQAVPFPSLLNGQNGDRNGGNEPPFINNVQGTPEDIIGRSERPHLAQIAPDHTGTAHELDLQHLIHKRSPSITDEEANILSDLFPQTESDSIPDDLARYHLEYGRRSRLVQPEDDNINENEEEKVEENPKSNPDGEPVTDPPTDPAAPLVQQPRFGSNPVRRSQPNPRSYNTQPATGGGHQGRAPYQGERLNIFSPPLRFQPQPSYGSGSGGEITDFRQRYGPKNPHSPEISTYPPYGYRTGRTGYQPTPAPAYVNTPSGYHAAPRRLHATGYTPAPITRQSTAANIYDLTLKREVPVAQPVTEPAPVHATDPVTPQPNNRQFAPQPKFEDQFEIRPGREIEVGGGTFVFPAASGVGIFDVSVIPSRPTTPTPATTTTTTPVPTTSTTTTPRLVLTSTAVTSFFGIDIFNPTTPTPVTRRTTLPPTPKQTKPKRRAPDYPVPPTTPPPVIVPYTTGDNGYSDPWKVTRLESTTPGYGNGGVPKEWATFATAPPLHRNTPVYPQIPENPYGPSSIVGTGGDLKYPGQFPIRPSVVNGLYVVHSPSHHYNGDGTPKRYPGLGQSRTRPESGTPAAYGNRQHPHPPAQIGEPNFPPPNIPNLAPTQILPQGQCSCPCPAGFTGNLQPAQNNFDLSGNGVGPRDVNLLRPESTNPFDNPDYDELDRQNRQFLEQQQQFQNNIPFNPRAERAPNNQHPFHAPIPTDPLLRQSRGGYGIQQPQPVPSAEPVYGIPPGQPAPAPVPQPGGYGRTERQTNYGGGGSEPIGHAEPPPPNQPGNFYPGK